MSRQLAVIPEDIEVDSEERKMRNDILTLDGKCEYCRHRDANTMDHYRSLVRNSQPTVYCNDMWNSIPCCGTCNSSKGNRTFVEWMDSPSKCSAKHVMTSEELAEVIDKFKRYDSLFDQYCMKKKVDPAWWASMSDDLTTFLKTKQKEIDEYQKSVVVKGNTIVYGRKKAAKPVFESARHEAYLPTGDVLTKEIAVS